MKPPVCRCHGEPMRWAKSNKRAGWWRCVVKQREYVNRNNDKMRATPEGRRRKTLYMLGYRQRRKAERYGRDGLVNQGLARGNNGQEDHPRRDQPVTR